MHKFDFDQELYVEGEVFTGIVKVAAKLQCVCETHKAPKYGVAAGDRHFSYCERLLTPVGRRN
jgi:hypothetical protein